MASPPAHRASPPVLPDELVEEILLRLPPDDPACLIRSSVVCKTWGSAVTHPSFRRRIHELHRTPPVLGFLHDCRDEGMANFIPTTASAFSLAAPDRRFWRALDCRHGRALFLSKGRNTKELLVWEPVTGRQRRVSVPAAFGCLNAAVFCTAEACDHRDCHGGPFGVGFVFTDNTDDEEYTLLACVYSSETSTWGKQTSMLDDFSFDFTYYSSLLVGRSVLYFMSDDGFIVEYDLARNELTVIDAPPGSPYRFTLMLAEDGGLGLIQDLDSHLKLWSRETSARWVLSRIIYLDNLLPVDALVDAESSLFVTGFAEVANVIFVNTAAGLFTIELLSERVRKVYGNNDFSLLIPVVGFYSPVSRNEHQALPRLNVSEEERGEEEKTVDQTQQLFDNRSNDIKERTSSKCPNLSAMS
ncbi:unnamed protein product, partial [Alopecurus aequalis]